MLKIGRKPRKFDSRIPHHGALKAMLRATGVARPALPVTLDNATALPSDVGMMLNDQLSCCVEAGAFHDIQLWTEDASGTELTEPDPMVLIAYREWAGYRGGLGAQYDAASDDGTVVQDFLRDWMNTGLTMADGTRHRISAYFELDLDHPDDLCEAAMEFGAVMVGFNVPAGFMEDVGAGTQVWDAKPSYGATVGGHCLDGDTRIPLLSGKSITIAEMAANPGGEYWVYSTDERGKMRPGRVSYPRLTRKGAEVIKVTLDNGESVTCTADHPFMLRDGSYLPAGKLQIGASLMPNYRRISDKGDGLVGYEMFLDNASGSWNWTHRRVVDTVCGLRPGLVIHHGDFDRLNNDPSNLFPMTWKAHTELHSLMPIALHDYARSDRGRQRSRELMSALWADPEWRIASLKRVGNNGRRRFLELAKKGLCGFQTWTDEQWKVNGKKNGDRLRGKPRDPNAARQGGATRRARMNNDPAYAKNLRDIARRNLAEHNRAVTAGEKPVMTEAQLNARRENARVLNQKRWNHTVVSVEPAGYADVYDLTVDRYHNFAIDSGIFLHNCVVLTGFDRTVPSTPSFPLMSWGQKNFRMMWPFLARYADEAYAIVDPLWVEKSGKTPYGLDLASLEAFGDALREGAIAAALPVDRGALAAARAGRARSPHWETVRDEGLAANPACIATGLTAAQGARLERHHDLPFHFCIVVGRPSFELWQGNLVTLCREPIDAHLYLGHDDDFERSDRDPIGAATTWHGKSEAEIRTDPAWIARKATAYATLRNWKRADYLAFRAECDRRMPIGSPEYLEINCRFGVVDTPYDEWLAALPADGPPEPA